MQRRERLLLNRFNTEKMNCFLPPPPLEKRKKEREEEEEVRES
jgi:hypothetical protein